MIVVMQGTRREEPRGSTGRRWSRRQFIRRSSLLAAGSQLGFWLPNGGSTASAAQAGPGASVIAETVFGKIRGSLDRGVYVFKGIPYGASTAGKNRFKPALDPKPWAGVRDTLAYGRSTPQRPPEGSGLRQGESEDCLVLNVWSGGLDDGGKRPVMLWAHGGGFRSGSGSSPLYDGTNLCLRGDVVVVTINHRLNVLGFMHLGDLGGEEFAKSGSVGMLDVVHSLAWVRDNIEQFGGDPNRVMVFGESGGGRKVNCLLGMPDAKGLFHRACSESGATLKVVERDAANELAARVLAELGLGKNEVHKIQEVPVAKIMAAYFTVSGAMGVAVAAGMGFAPVLDGVVMPQHPYYPDASPVNPEVPLLVGANRTEMTLFSRSEDDFSLDEAGMRQRIQSIVGEARVDEVVSAYRQANPGASSSEIHFLVWSDQRYVLPSIKIAERRSALGGAPTYLYYFRWELDERRMTPHASEIAFVFDNLHTRENLERRQQALALSAKMSDAWIAFARTGDPNTEDLPIWHPYNVDRRSTMVFDLESRLVNDPIRSQRAVLDPILGL